MAGADVEPSCECSYLRAELARRDEQIAARDAQIASLTRTAEDQAHSIAELTGAEPGAAPSVACVYWLYAPTRWHGKSWKKERSRLMPFVSAMAEMPANLVTPLVWDQHRERRKTAITRTGTHVCDHTLNIELGYAKTMLSWAVSRDMIRRNALLAAKRVKTKSQRETALSAAEVDRLLDIADDIVDERLCPGDDDGQRAALLRAFVLCCFDSMLRFNEARLLRRDRIGPGGVVGLLASETKSERPRSIVLTPRTLDALAAIRSIDGLPYFFVSTVSASVIGENTLRGWFRRACEKAGLDRFVVPRDKQLRVHDLRASGATVADQAGARPKAIQDALGHASIATTARYIRSGRDANAQQIADVMVKATAGARRGPKRARKKYLANAIRVRR